jgi:hypothetical protein
MAEQKGVGKEYNPDDFSKPAQEAGDGSRAHKWVGLAVVVLLVAGGGFFLFGMEDGATSNGITGATIVAYCVDSDGGYNRFTRGITVGTYYLNYGEGEYTDSCAGDENKLTEYYCKNDLVVYTTEPCPEGMVCQDGICMT